MKSCIDLKELCGSRWRVKVDKESQEGRADKWLYQIPCQRGLIYPYGGKMLGVQIDGHSGIAKRAQALGFQMIQDGDREKTFLVPADRIDEVAELIRPYRKRTMTPEQRAAAADRLAQFRAGSEK